MSRWSAPSDLDYYDEMDGHRPTAYDVICIACSRHFSVRADDRPPYRCERCCLMDETKAEIERERVLARTAG